MVMFLHLTRSPVFFFLKTSIELKIQLKSLSINISVYNKITTPFPILMHMQAEASLLLVEWKPATYVVLK